MNKLVSIIIPIFNCEKYLQDCLTSIINQTYSNIEIILVNDGSTDNSQRIGQDFQSIDNRIIIINKDNGGLSSARNSGIEVANGDYLVFIDSDDYVELDMIEHLYFGIVNNDCDISICGVVRENSDGSILEYVHYKDVVLEQMEAISLLLKDNQIRNYTWNKMYKKKLFDDIRFPEGKIFEDVLTTYKLFMKSTILYSSSKILYHYMNRENSIVNTNNPNKVISLYNAYMTQYNDIFSSIPVLGGLIKYQRTIHEINYYLHSEHITISTFIKLKRKIKNIRNYYKSSSVSYLGAKDKLKFFIMSRVTFIYLIIRRRKIYKISKK